eukprot:258810-Ditylum_brightwellii.AAC.1
MVLIIRAHNDSPCMAGVDPPNLLEVYQTAGCKKMVHHLCQTKFEHGHNINASLSKKCMCCLLLIIEKQNSSTTDGDTSTNAAHHTVTVNVHMHASPANQYTDPKSSANTSRQTNGNSSTPCMNELNSHVSFADANAERSNVESYKLSLSAQKGSSKCSCIFPPHVFLYGQFCVGKGIEIAERFSEDAGLYVYGKITSVP